MNEYVGNLMSNITTFIKKNVVMCMALLAAIITSCIVPIDKEYIGYFDYKTLTCLFCVLAVVCALKNIKFFYMLARQVVQLFKTTRMSILALIENDILLSQRQIKRKA